MNLYELTLLILLLLEQEHYEHEPTLLILG